MKTRRRFLAVKCGPWALLALLALALVPHGHGGAGSSGDDCVLCHAQHAPAVVAQPTDALPASCEADRVEAAPGGDERERSLAGHPTRAPPA